MSRRKKVHVGVGSPTLHHYAVAVTVRISQFSGTPFSAPYSPKKTHLKNYPEDCLEQQDLSTTLSVNGRCPCPSLPEVCYVVQNEDSLNIIVKS